MSKNNFLVLGEGHSFWINGSFDSAEKKFSINFRKANTKFSLSLHYNADNNCLFVNGREPTMITLQLSFVSEVFLMDLVLLSLEKYF